MSRSSYSHVLSKRASALVNSSVEVKKWFDETSGLKSPRTAIDYTDSFTGFVSDVGMPPSELVRLNSDQAYDLMKDWGIQKRKSQTISDGRIKQIWFGAVSFFRYHKIKVDSELPFSQMEIKFRDKIPTKSELKQILDVTPSISTKIAVQLMAYSGLRPEDVADLTYGSVREDLEAEKYPCAAWIPQGKTKQLYVTFTPKVTCELINRYLQYRKERGEKIVDSSPVIRRSGDGEVSGVRRKTLTGNIELALKKSGLPLISSVGNTTRRLRPYSIRKYFSSTIGDRISTEYKEALLGHTKGLSQIYDGVRDASPEVLERMREMYRNVEAHLTVEGLDEEGIMQKVGKEIGKQAKIISDQALEVSELKEDLGQKDMEMKKQGADVQLLQAQVVELRLRLEESELFPLKVPGVGARIPEHYFDWPQDSERFKELQKISPAKAEEYRKASDTIEFDKQLKYHRVSRALYGMYNYEIDRLGVEKFEKRYGFGPAYVSAWDFSIDRVNVERFVERTHLVKQAHKAEFLQWLGYSESDSKTSKKGGD